MARKQLKQPETMPQLLKTEDACAMLAIGKTSFYKLVYSGELPAVRHGRKLRVSVDAIRKWIADREQAS